MVGLAQHGIKAQDQTTPKKPITLIDPDFSPAQRAVLSLFQKGATVDRRGDYGSAIKTFQDALQQLRSLPEMRSEEDSLLVRLGRAYIGARRPSRSVFCPAIKKRPSWSIAMSRQILPVLGQDP